ncbi:hypothetical protein Drorol1_Dr00004241 [Drosera rotundifolia]
MFERDGSAKGVVFSQIFSFLDLIQFSLVKVFLMDAWWNTADERQAMDTIYKIGQCFPIRIVKFIMENTVDERIFKLQEKKKQELEWTIGRFRSKQMEQMSGDDLKFVLTPENV